MSAANHEVMVVMEDGKPTTLINKDNNKYGFFSSAKFSKSSLAKNKDHFAQIEAKRLKNENGLLLQKIDSLEKENKKLNSQIIDQQLQHNHTKMNFNNNEKNGQGPTDNNTQTDDNDFICQQCRSSHNSNELSRLVDQANRHSLDHGVLLIIKPQSQKDAENSINNNRTDCNNQDNINNNNNDLSNNINNNNNLLENNNNKNDEIFKKLQEELVACKLREAESSLGFKELQQKVTQLGKQWQQFIKDCENSKNSSEIKNRTLLELKEVIMSLKVKETCMVSDYNELKQKLIELETENHVYKRQEKKLKESINNLEEKLSSSLLREDDLANENKELLRKMDALNAQYEESQIMHKIQYAEHCQAMADMRRKMAELEIENQELLTAFKLNPSNQPCYAYDPNPSNIPTNNPTTDNTNNIESTLEQQQQNVIDLLSNCDMSDIMTESFFADAIFGQPNLSALPTTINKN